MLIRLGKWEEAQGINAKILQLDPANEQARIREAALLRESLGEFESAIALLKDLLRTSQDKASVHFQLGLSYRDTANLVEAERHFTLAAQLNPENVEPHANLMLLARYQFNRGDFESTLQILKNYEVMQPLTMEGVLLRGVSYESLSMHA